MKLPQADDSEYPVDEGEVACEEEEYGRPRYVASPHLLHLHAECNRVLVECKGYEKALEEEGTTAYSKTAHLSKPQKRRKLCETQAQQEPTRLRIVYSPICTP